MADRKPRAAQAVERTRAWREAKRKQGFVKVEVWAPAACKADIHAAVQAIVFESTRGPALLPKPSDPKGVTHMDPIIDTAWTVHGVRDALATSSLVREGELSAQVMEGTEPVLLVTMHEYGDLPVYLSIGPLQMVVAVLLWPVDEQKEADKFNVFLLKAQKVVPLSNFGISTVDGRDYYELFGEISSKTSLQTVLIELRMLAANAIDAAGDLREAFENLGGKAA